MSRTTVKWLRCYHSDSNEGSQDTLGGCRRRGLGRGGGGRRESDGKEEGGGSEIESWRGRKRPAGFYLFILFFSLKLTMLTHNMLQCCHGNVPCDVLLTFTHHIILCKMFWCASGVVFIAFATAN